MVTGHADAWLICPVADPYCRVGRHDHATASTSSSHGVKQYATTTGNLEARIAVHAYCTNPQDWVSWLGERLPLAGEALEVGAGTGKVVEYLPP